MGLINGISGFFITLWNGIANIFGMFWSFKGMFFTGIRGTLLLSLAGVLIGTLIGTILAFMRISKRKLLRWPASAYIEFIRGTPLMVQVYFAAFGLPMVLPELFASGSINVRAAIVVGINSAAYVAEIVRSGIQAVDKGQTEAAKSLGMNNFQTMIHIILPQAIKNILPALANEFIVVIKESSIVSILGFPELMYISNKISSTTFNPFPPLVIVSLIYFTLTFTLSKLIARVEKNLDKSKTKAYVRMNNDFDENAVLGVQDAR